MCAEGALMFDASNQPQTADFQTSGARSNVSPLQTTSRFVPMWQMTLKLTLAKSESVSTDSTITAFSSFKELSFAK